MDRGPAVLRLADQISADLPRDLNVMIVGMTAPPAPFVPQAHHFRPGYALMVVGLGSQQQHAELLERIRRTLPPTFEFTTPLPYVQLQKFLDESNVWGSLA
jgi:hypothetical protein